MKILQTVVKASSWVTAQVATHGATLSKPGKRSTPSTLTTAPLPPLDISYSAGKHCSGPNRQIRIPSMTRLGREALCRRRCSGLGRTDRMASRGMSRRRCRGYTMRDIDLFSAESGRAPSSLTTAHCGQASVMHNQSRYISPGQHVYEPPHFCVRLSVMHACHDFLDG